MQFEPVLDWPLPGQDCAWAEVAGVAADGEDRVFVFARTPHRVLVFDRSGQLLRTWGEGQFARPHGIAFAPDGLLYLTDDLDHTVKRFSPDGRLLATLGTSGRPADTGATSVDFRTIRRAGAPFHFPTNVAFGHDGSIYVADGYGNARVHRFTSDGRLLQSWGEPGAGPGQFHIPHGIAVDPAGRVVVADRENSRLQTFSPDGEFLSEQTEIARPCQVTYDASGRMYVAELGYRAGMWPGTTAPTPNATGGRVTVFDQELRPLARWGGGDSPTAPGDFFAPHDLCVDSRGDVYVAEVTWSAGANRGLVDARCHALQKFTRR